MTIAQAIKTNINTFPKGKIFSYQDLPAYAKSSGSVIKTINRLVAKKELNRFSKGKFYVPKIGILGLTKPSDDELLRNILYKNNRLNGYITGLSLYNKLGLTSQVPRTITIACNGGRQQIEYKTIRIKKIVAPFSIEEKNIKLVQYLDVLKDIKKIPDSDINQTLKRMRRFISELSNEEQNRLVDLAIRYYAAQIKALCALLLCSLNQAVSDKLKNSLNPITSYKLGLDQNSWPMAKAWNIK